MPIRRRAMARAADPTDQITAAFAAVQIVLTVRQAEQFASYLAELQRWSARINLTRLTRTDEIIQEHFIDSAMGLAVLPAGAHNVLDLGSGAGLPGLAIKILRPELEVWLLDSVQKKASFLNVVIGRLGLTNVTVVAERAELVSARPELRGRFVVVTARALARPDAALTLCRPFCAPSGRILLYLSARDQPIWPANVAVAAERRYRLPGHRDDRIVVALSPKR